MTATAVTRCPERPPMSPAECTEADCENSATVRLHIPWADNRVVCSGHARVYAQQDGIVADPLESADDEFP